MLDIAIYASHIYFQSPFRVNWIKIVVLYPGVSQHIKWQFCGSLTLAGFLLGPE